MRGGGGTWMSPNQEHACSYSPTGAVWLPGPQTDPAELRLAGTAVHVIAAAILLNGSMTLWTLL